MHDKAIQDQQQLTSRTMEILSLADQDGDRVANEKACHKLAGNSRRLKKNNKKLAYLQTL